MSPARNLVLEIVKNRFDKLFEFCFFDPNLHSGCGFFSIFSDTKKTPQVSSLDGFLSQKIQIAIFLRPK